MNTESQGIYCNDIEMERIKQAMHRSDSEAIEMLDAAMLIHPADPRLALLRGSIYASQQNYQAAQSDLTQAIVLDPDLHAARFMLGYLELCHAHPAKAAGVWQPLTTLTDNDSMRDFALGMIHLIGDRFAEAARLFEQGLRSDQATPEIASFIQDLLEKTRQTMAENGDDDDGDNDPSASHLLLKGYTLNS
jgi:Flp pilus assembly protein TadD